MGGAGSSSLAAETGVATLGVGFDPMVGDEIGGDAGGEEGERGADGKEDPGELDAALEHEVVEEAEDQDEHGCLGEEGGAAASGDDQEVGDARGGVG